MLPGAENAGGGTEYVLLQAIELEDGDRPAWEEVARVATYSREKAWELLQGRDDWTGGLVLEAETRLRLVTASSWGEPFPVTARRDVRIEGGPA